jgi:hypothetical protein
MSNLPAQGHVTDLDTCTGLATSAQSKTAHGFKAAAWIISIVSMRLEVSITTTMVAVWHYSFAQQKKESASLLVNRDICIIKMPY